MIKLTITSMVKTRKEINLEAAIKKETLGGTNSAEKAERMISNSKTIKLIRNKQGKDPGRLRG